MDDPDGRERDKDRPEAGERDGWEAEEELDGRGAEEECEEVADGCGEAEREGRGEGEWCDEREPDDPLDEREPDDPFDGRPDDPFDDRPAGPLEVGVGGGGCGAGYSSPPGPRRMPGGTRRGAGAGWDAGGVLGFSVEEPPFAWLESLVCEVVPPPHAHAGIAIADCAPVVARTPPNRTIRERVGARASSDSALGSYSTAELGPAPSFGLPGAHPCTPCVTRGRAI